MAEKIIEVEADSLEEARQEIISQIPKGFQVVTEQIISDGKPQTTMVYGETTKAALANVQSNLPNNAEPGTTRRRG